MLPRTSERILFLVFILIYSMERIWETFFTTKERRRTSLHGDWPLVLVTISYEMMCFSMIFEFFTRVGSINSQTLIVGFIFFIVGALLRYSGIKALGRQWSIHAVGAVKIGRKRLLRLGAYKYIRHPVYLGVMLEELGMPLLFSCYYTSLFSVIVCWPLVIVRAVEEERSALRKFGSKYLQYKSEVNMFFPFKHFRCKFPR